MGALSRSICCMRPKNNRTPAQESANSQEPSDTGSSFSVALSDMVVWIGAVGSLGSSSDNSKTNGESTFDTSDTVCVPL